MEKCLLDYLNEVGSDDKRTVTTTLKALAFNGIYDIDTLMKVKPEELQKIKGIGPKSMALIAKVVTKEQMIRDKKKDVYDKACHKVECTCLRDWFKKAGLSYLSACQLDRILKKNGINTVDKFMKTTFGEFEAMKGIASKRLETIATVKQMIEKKKKKA